MKQHPGDIPNLPSGLDWFELDWGAGIPHFGLSFNFRDSPQLLKDTVTII